MTISTQQAMQDVIDEVMSRTGNDSIPPADVAQILTDLNDTFSHSADMTRRTGISMEEFIDGPLTNTKYQEFLTSKLKDVSNSGGACIRLPKGFQRFDGDHYVAGGAGFGTDPMFGTVLEEPVVFYSNVYLDGGGNFRSNALVADKDLPRSATIVRAATIAEAGRAATTDGKSAEYNYGMLGCFVHGAERHRPVLTTQQKFDLNYALQTHGWMIDFDATEDNGGASGATTLAGVNDLRLKLFGNLFNAAPESALRIKGRGEMQVHFNQIALARVFGFYLASFDNHLGFNVINNIGHTGALIYSGNQRIAIWKLWFIGYLPTDNRFGGRDALYDAIASTNPAINPILDTSGSPISLPYSLCLDNLNGTMNQEIHVALQDCFGHGVRDRSRSNLITVSGDMVGAMGSGDFGQIPKSGDDRKRSVLVYSGENSNLKVNASHRDPTMYAGHYQTWAQSTAYTTQSYVTDGTIYARIASAHTSPASGTLAADVLANPSRYTLFKGNNPASFVAWTPSTVMTADVSKVKVGSDYYTCKTSHTSGAVSWAADQAEDGSRWLPTPVTPVQGTPVRFEKVNEGGFNLDVAYDERLSGFSGTHHFSAVSRATNRSQGQMRANGRLIMERTFTPANKRITTAGVALDLERPDYEFNVVGSDNVGGTLGNGRAENLRKTIRMRRTPTHTGMVVITGTFAGGTTLTIDSDYANVELEFAINPSEVSPDGSNGRWVVISGPGVVS